MIEENEEIEQQKAEIARHTRELDEALSKLKQATAKPLGLADRIREEPLLWLGGSFIVGLLLGSRNHRMGEVYYVPGTRNGNLE
jgi:hypothetical protein